jgi:DNA repair protein RadC
MTFNLSLPQELPLTTRRTVQRALSLLENHLREPGTSFTSTTIVRDWLRLKMTGLGARCF